MRLSRRASFDAPGRAQRRPQGPVPALRAPTRKPQGTEPPAPKKADPRRNREADAFEAPSRRAKGIPVRLCSMERPSGVALPPRVATPSAWRDTRYYADAFDDTRRRDA
ncbi:hypothetical protein LZ198_23850 [Myxococcus sp. K15C18031901]|uniref:hypothetical protein n=1 Tax=Myxococcus dinghuensis TaxID=2906761 RepID=UPI0020A82F71|nr:hypothetical protein [Myxococcus dinghuensis]MCP3101904.1 hypothetical protein [Myxococcus dinghuensis]